jgi:internalin A
MSLDNLSRLTGFERLQSIDSSATKVSDLALLAAPKALRSLDCSHTQVSNLAPLAQILSLHQITADGLTLTAYSTRCFDLPAPDEFTCAEARLRGAPVEVLLNLGAKIASHGFAPIFPTSLRAPSSRATPNRWCLAPAASGRPSSPPCAGLFPTTTLPYTHGIVVGSFDLPRSDRTDFARVHIWDFGGQDTYHGGHALFIANRVCPRLSTCLRKP